MKNFFKKTTLIPILFAMLIYSPLITSHATHLETQTKRQSLQKGSVVQDQHVFAIPDNGWNVVDIELDYYESYYSSTNTQNAFPFRQKFYMIKRSGAGANNISVDVSNALHTDGTNKVIISPFQQGDLLVDTSKWEWGKAHPDTGYQRCDNTEGVGKNVCGKLGFCIQLAKSDHLGGVLGCIFVCELFCIDFICIHGLLPPSFDGSMIPAKNE